VCAWLAAALALASPAASATSPALHPVIVVLRQHAQLGPVRIAGEKGLRGAAMADQASVRLLLSRAQAGGEADRVRPLWIVNQIAVRASDALVAQLRARPDVSAVVPDAPIALTLAATPAAATPAVAANLATIGAPALWNAGALGQGVVVASLDTGVDTTDGDLAASYRGGANSWFDPYGQHATPFDANGHGTWTLGVMVGGTDTGTAVGVAPSARWIAARVFDDSGRATVSAIHAAFQWVLDPDGNPATNDAPQVVDAPWAIDAPGCDTTFQPDILALRAAGVAPVFAAGNAGPLDQSDRSPANNAGAISVGATDALDGIAPFSSRGPSSCTGLPFPTLTAPGVGIPTTDRFGLGTVELGTSMAAPHVAGALALLLGAFPGLTADQQEAALTAGAADLGVPGPDSVFGFGRLDASASYTYASGGATTGVLLADGFESHDLSAWDGRHGRGLRVSAAAALSGGYGLEVRGVQGPSAVVDRHVAGRESVRIEVKIAARSLDTARHWDDAVAGYGPRGQKLFAVQVRSVNGTTWLRLLARTGASGTATAGYRIGTGGHDVEVVWSPLGTGADLHVDGVAAGHVAGAARRVLGRVQLGWLFGDGPRSGSLLFDDYRSEG
jgi:subtilisin family serine protease